MSNQYSIINILDNLISSQTTVCSSLIDTRKEKLNNINPSGIGTLTIGSILASNNISANTIEILDPSDPSYIKIDVYDSKIRINGSLSVSNDTFLDDIYCSKIEATNNIITTENISAANNILGADIYSNGINLHDYDITSGSFNKGILTLSSSYKNIAISGFGLDGNYLSVVNPSGTGTLTIDNISAHTNQVKNIIIGTANSALFNFDQPILIIGTNNDYSIGYQQYPCIPADSIIAGKDNYINNDDGNSGEGFLFGTGLYTMIGDDPTVVIGKYNDNFDIDYNTVFTIGNGTDQRHRSNALTIDYQGNIWTSGIISAGGFYSQQPTYVSTLVVDNIGSQKTYNEQDVTLSLSPEAITLSTYFNFEEKHISDFIQSISGLNILNLVLGATNKLSGSLNAIFGLKNICSGYVNFIQGTDNKVSGNFSHVQGGNNQVYSNGNHVEGQSNFISGGNYSHIEGAENKVYINNAHAEGQRNEIYGKGGHAEGLTNIVSGQYAHAEGRKNQAKGLYSHAEGQFTKAIGRSSISFGSYTQAKGDYSLAGGLSCITNNTGSHAEGDNSSTNGNYSHAQGLSAMTFGLGSHAEGDSTSAFAAGSHVEGWGTQSWNPSNKSLKTGAYSFQHIEGKWNSTNRKELFDMQYVVGGGTGPNDRKTIYRRDWNGNVWTNGNISASGLTISNSIKANSIISAAGFYDTTLGKIISGGADGNYLSAVNPSGTGIFYLNNGNIDLGSNNTLFDHWQQGYYKDATQCIILGNNNDVVNHISPVAGSIIIGDNNTIANQDVGNISNSLIVGFHNDIDSSAENISFPNIIFGSYNYFYRNEEDPQNISIDILEGNHFSLSSLTPNVKYQLVVGGGTSNNDKKNIYTRDYSGNTWQAGNFIASGNAVTSGNIYTNDMFMYNLTSSLISSLEYATEAENAFYSPLKPVMVYNGQANNLPVFNFNNNEMYNIILTAATSITKVLMPINIPTGQGITCKVKVNSANVKLAYPTSDKIIINGTGTYIISFVNIDGTIDCLPTIMLD